MVDHFTILQFLLTGEPMNTDACNVKPPAVCGDFDVEAMDALFQLVRSKELSNVTVQVKGWVGPIIAQRDKWPPQMHTPADGAEKRAAMAERFNSELAFFQVKVQPFFCISSLSKLMIIQAAEADHLPLCQFSDTNEPSSENS